MKYIDNRLSANIIRLEDKNNNYTSENVEGALEEIDSKIKDIENSTIHYITPYMFGGVGDGVTDDTNALKQAILKARQEKKVLKLDGKFYVTETLNVTNIKIKGVTKCIANLNSYNSQIYGYLVYNFMKNEDYGAKVTFRQMIDEAITGTCIVSDIANPILKVNFLSGDVYGFDLENVGVIGWIRNTQQIGVKATYDNTLAYIPGNHKFKDLVVAGCGSDGVNIPSLECTYVEGVECYCNNGYGFKIEGSPTIDTPFEYTYFTNCKFNNNKKDGFYANNFRKNVSFEKCMVNNNGQYDYGITVPSTTEALASGIRIDGVHWKDSSNFTGLNIKFVNIYGELCEKAIHINNQVGAKVINNIIIKDCHTVRRNSNISTLFFLNIGYIFGLEVYGSQPNVNDFCIITGILGGSNFRGQPEFYEIIETKSYFDITTNNIYCNDIKTAQGYYQLISQTTSETIINTDIPKQNLKTYYPSSETAFKYSFYYIGYNCSQAGGNDEKGDIFGFTRDNNGKYIIIKLTNNLTDLSVDSNGNVIFTCPAWRSVTLQQLDNNLF